jgi:hypothetical protein
MAVLPSDGNEFPESSANLDHALLESLFYNEWRHGR